MISPESFIDIHCHMLPGLDDGPNSWEDAIEMAKIASEDGIGTVVVTPHQLGGFTQNTPAVIREHAARFQAILERHGIPLCVVPGADVRIEPDLVEKIKADKVMTLADQGRYVLLELPHEIFFPLEGLLNELRAAEMVGILSHPERNRGILNQPKLLYPLLEQGCLLQITAGSLLGRFGDTSKKFSEWMLKEQLVHFVCTDAHGPRSRVPILSSAFERVTRLLGRDCASDLFYRNSSEIVRRTLIPIHRKATSSENPRNSSDMIPKRKIA
jgi:protein-tyrosine phosphatase